MNKGKKTIFSWFQRNVMFLFFLFFREILIKENPQSAKEPYLIMYMKSMTEHIQSPKKQQQRKIGMVGMCTL